jgi:HSP20 family molecular chaperone IbpA
MKKVIIYDIETLKEYFLIVAFIPGEKPREFKVNIHQNDLEIVLSPSQKNIKTTTG